MTGSALRSGLSGRRVLCRAPTLSEVHPPLIEGAERALLMAKPRVRMPSATEEPKARASRAAMTWMQPGYVKVYDIDVSMCPECGGRLKVLAAITDPPVIQAPILAHSWREA